MEVHGTHIYIYDIEVFVDVYISVYFITMCLLNNVISHVSGECCGEADKWFI